MCHYKTKTTHKQNVSFFLQYFSLLVDASSIAPYSQSRVFDFEKKKSYPLERVIIARMHAGSDTLCLLQPLRLLLFRRCRCGGPSQSCRMRGTFAQKENCARQCRAVDGTHPHHIVRSPAPWLHPYIVLLQLLLAQFCHQKWHTCRNKNRQKQSWVLVSHPS